MNKEKITNLCVERAWGPEKEKEKWNGEKGLCVKGADSIFLWIETFGKSYF